MHDSISQDSIKGSPLEETSKKGVYLRGGIVMGMSQYNFCGNKYGRKEMSGLEYHSIAGIFIDGKFSLQRM